MRKVVNGVLCDTDQSTLIAHDRVFDGREWMKRLENKFLYQTPTGEYFLYIKKYSPPKKDSIILLSEKGAYNWYYTLPEKVVELKFGDDYETT